MSEMEEVRRPNDVKHSTSQNTLVEVLEVVLDKGVVIAGDITISLADVELITIKIRLLVASVDRAKDMGIDWWEHDPWLSSKAQEEENEQEKLELQNQIQQLEERLAATEKQIDKK